MQGGLDPFFQWLATAAPKISNGSEMSLVVLMLVAGYLMGAWTWGRRG